MVRQLLENSAVRITTAIAAAVFCVGFVWTAASWATNVSRDLREIRTQLTSLVGQVDDRWRRADMRRWVLDTEKLNPDWTAATVPEESS